MVDKMTDIDTLDNSWNPQQSLRAMQANRAQIMGMHPLRTSCDDFIIPRFNKLDQCIVLKRLGLEEMACIVNS